MNGNPFPGNIRHVAIVSPGSPAKNGDLRAGCKVLESWGLRVSVMPHVLDEAPEDYLSAGIGERAADLHSAWCDKSVDAVICARGGYGSAQLLPHLDWTLLKSRRLPFLGYSDITALHLAMFLRGAGMPIASPMVSELPKLKDDQYTLSSLRRALSPDSKPQALPFPPHSRYRIRIIKAGSASGAVLPVNLTLLASLAGTGFMPDMKGKILLVEDVGEKIRRLDAALTQVRLAGLLESCSALIFGSLRNCGTRDAQDLLMRRFAEYVKGPVLAGFPFGHALPMHCLRYGVRIRIAASGELTT
ncbi:MAG: hypothetical protein A2X49_02190 [Lentisphaerae bacterium GWF2_52_8]|nr:MAG: hypothetical protein A2X49_02190 [Lentisphaerae bacterium GWF2_52_8]